MSGFFEKKSVRIIFAVLIVAALGFGIYGTVYGVKDAVKMKKKADKYKQEASVIEFSEETKVFKADGYKITLPKDFDNEDTSVEYNEYISDDVKIYIGCNPFEETKGIEDFDDAEYCRYLVYLNDNPKYVLKTTDDGITYFEYKFNGSEFNLYRTYVFKGEKAFYFINFILRSSDNEVVSPHLLEWIKTFEIIG